MALNVPWADGVDKADETVFRPLTEAATRSGFSCGPADLGTFNWILNQLSEQTINNTAQSIATSNMTQGTIA